MSQSVSVIKQRGQRPSEQFSDSKLKSSIESACLSVNLSEGVASDTANHVCQAVEAWLQSKHEVTSDDIRRVATQALTVISPEASYLYKHHHKIL